MIPNENAVLIFKFGEYRWMQKLIEGDVNFSCTGAFIHQAKSGGNDVQGDRYEGVFARLDNSDQRIAEMKIKLGNDLEIINEGNFKLLRRKSSKKKPIFCFYGYKAGDMLVDGDIDATGYKVIRHDFDDRMYSGFANSINSNVIADSHRFTQVTIQPKPFVDRVKIAMIENSHKYRMRAIDYDLFSAETFFIEPTDKYEELFHKFPQYKYQYEGRICILGIDFDSVFDRYSLRIIPLKEDDYKITHTPLYMEFGTEISKKY